MSLICLPEGTCHLGLLACGFLEGWEGLRDCSPPRHLRRRVHGWHASALLLPFTFPLCHALLPSGAATFTVGKVVLGAIATASPWASCR